MEISVFSAFQTNNVVLRYVKNSPILRNSLIPVEMVFPETRSTEKLTCFGMRHQPGWHQRHAIFLPYFSRECSHTVLVGPRE